MNIENTLRQKRPSDGRVLARPPFRQITFLVASGFCACLGHWASAAAVSARVAAVKGVVTAATQAAGDEPLRTGTSVRAGTVISTAVDAGALLRPSPKVSLVVHMSSKVRFDGADVDGRGVGTVKCSLLNGRVLALIDSESENSESAGKVKVSITTQEGAIVGSKGSWTVLQEEGRSVVAVGQGKADVSIGGGGSEVGSQVEVPEGSVIWLQRRADGLVEAKVVNTETGAMIVILPDGTRDTSQKAPPELLAEARDLLNNSGDSTATVTNTPLSNLPGTPGTETPLNPDFSNPKPVLPVASSDTP